MARRLSTEAPSGDEEPLVSDYPSPASSPTAAHSTTDGPPGLQRRRSHLLPLLCAAALCAALLWGVAGGFEWTRDQAESLSNTVAAFLFSVGWWDRRTPTLPSSPLLRPLSPLLLASNHSRAALCLEKFNGRWGNHVYRAMMAATLALRYHLPLYLPRCPWEPLFPDLAAFIAPCPWLGRERVRLQEESLPPRWWDTDPRALARTSDFYALVDGWFQEDTAVYAPYADHIRALLAPDPRLHAALRALQESLLSRHCSDALLVTVHVRHGDFPDLTSNTSPMAVRIPVAWYLRWLEGLKAEHGSALQRLKALQDRDCPAAVNGTWDGRFALFVVSDDAEAVVHEFRAAHYSADTTADVLSGHYLSSPFASLAADVTDFYLDWWLLSQARVLATSHSTFSLTAAVLSPHYRVGEALFFRPDPQSMSIARFDPWAFKYDYTAFYNQQRSRDGSG